MIALLAFAAAMAVTPPTCDEPQTQFEMNRCAAEDYKKADAELNARWAMIAAILRAQDEAGHAPKDGRPGYYPALLEAQRAWIRFRDLECRVQGYAMRGGSAESVVVSTCLAELTRARSRQLKEMAANYQQ